MRIDDSITQAKASTGSVFRVNGSRAKHGYSYAAEYRAWQTMRLRCTEPSNSQYPNYGGRGIRVCERWLNSVEAFIEDMGPKPSPKHELDRYPDNNGNYEPGNCRWATRSENDRNRRSNRLIECRGEKLPLVAWSERSGVGVDTIRHRIAKGWDSDRAIFTPARPKAPAGLSKGSLGSACIACGRHISFTAARCKSCENVRRSHERNAVVPQAAADVLAELGRAA